MHAAQLIWILTLALTLSAALLDWRSRRIPNWLTMSGLFLGIVVHAVLSGWHGIRFALEGASLGLAVLFPLVLLRGLGAGDWKLIGAVGAMLGPVLLLFVLLGSTFTAGFMAIVQVMRAGRVLRTFRNLWVLMKGFFSFGLRTHPQISLNNPQLLKLPFGVAVAVATLLCYCAARWWV